MPIDIGRNEVQRLLREGASIVEVLPSEQFADEHLPDAISLPLETLNAHTAAQLLDRNAPVIVYCNDTL